MTPCVALLASLAACRTVEAVSALPESWWVSTEAVLIALLQDLFELVSWLL